MHPKRWTALTALLALLVALGAFAPALAVAQEQEQEQETRPDQVRGIDPADMDLSVDPAEDFYRFANGGWLDRTEIPADEGSYGVFIEVDDRVTDQLLDLLNGLLDGEGVQGGTDEWKAVELYRQGIDLATRNAQGIEPIRPILREIDAIRDLTGFHQFLEGATFRGIDGLFSIGVFPGLDDSSVNIVGLSGPYLGLPNRDYYLEDTPANEEVRAAYIATSAELLGFIGDDEDRALRAAQAVYDLERRLAEPTLTREEEQDISNFNNPTTIAELSDRYPLMDWSRYLETLDLEGTKTLLAEQNRYLDALPAIVAETPIQVLKDYLTLELLWWNSGRLSEEMAATAFEFWGGVLTGVEEQRPIEERALGAVNGLLGEAVGRLYVAEYFPPEAKTQIEELVAELIRAYRVRLEANPWMTPETKAEALTKLDQLRVKVGYPDDWRSYGAVTIEGSYAATIQNAINAETRRALRQAGQPVDRDEWGLPPQTVNAYYNPQNNEIVFPAGILQPPFFDYRADPASNYGAIGFVIGHEITHGFDIGGSQFDANGNLVNWWSEEDYARFQELNDLVVAQYDVIEVLPDVFVDGQITVGENVADLGGLQVAYDALQHHLATDGRPLPPPPFTAAGPGQSRHFTQEQRFFIAAATVWHAVIRDEALLTQVLVDPHAPTEVRGTQPLRNMDAFHDAFGIDPGDAMFLPPAERIVIW